MNAFNTKDHRQFFILLSEFVFELKFIYLFVFRIEIRFYLFLFKRVQSRLNIRASSISKYIVNPKKKKKKNDKNNMKKVFLFSRFKFLKRNLKQIVKETFTIRFDIFFF